MQAGKVAGNGAVAAEGDGGSSLVDDAVSTLFTEPQSSTSGGEYEQRSSTAFRKAYRQSQSSSRFSKDG